jgi:glyoxylase-like metal-dependent hydrolase (beta-lactamase superfamily II)
VRALWLCAGLLSACASPSAAEPEPASAVAREADLPEVGLAIVKTSQRSLREGLVYEGGDFFKHVETAFSAFLVKHGESYLLFDTGLGSQIAEQYGRDMPWLRRLMFRYDDPVMPVREQLSAFKLPRIERIILSHAHWDHASGVTDFPGVEVWVSAPERELIRGAHSAAASAWPSQVSDPSIRWQSLTFSDGAHEGFDQSLDLFRDGKVVLVPMYGHTPGSVGMFVRVDSGRRLFLVGDVVWNAGALPEAKPKFWPARRMVDHDADATLETVGLIREAMRRDPKLVVLPAHDGNVQARLGFFPRWVR